MRNPVRWYVDENCFCQNLIQPGKVMPLRAMLLLFEIIALVFFWTNFCPLDRTLRLKTFLSTHGTWFLRLWESSVFLTGRSSFCRIISHHPFVKTNFKAPCNVYLVLSVDIKPFGSFFHKTKQNLKNDNKECLRHPASPPFQEKITSFATKASHHFFMFIKKKNYISWNQGIPPFF